MNIKLQLGQHIAKHRKQKQLSQEKLAFLAGIHPDYIGKIERGERMPSIVSLLKILDAMHVKYPEFFEDLQNLK